MENEQQNTNKDDIKEYSTKEMLSICRDWGLATLMGEKRSVEEWFASLNKDVKNNNNK